MIVLIVIGEYKGHINSDLDSHGKLFRGNKV